MTIIKSARLPLSIFFLSTLMQALYIGYANFGKELLSPFPVSDAYMYNYFSWFLAFIDDSGGFTRDIIPFSLYAKMLSWAYMLIGPYIWVPFLVNSLLTSSTVMFLALASRNIYGEIEGWIAGLLGVFFGLFIFFSGLTLKINLVLPLLAANIYFLSKYFKSKKYVYLTISLTALIIAAFIRHNLIAIVFLLLLILFVQAINSRQAKDIVKTITSSLIAICILLSIFPWNPDEKEQKFIAPIGINFYAGNSPQSWGGYTEVPGVPDNVIGHRLYGNIPAERAYGRPVTKWESSKYWIAKSYNYYKNHPSDYAILFLKKMGLTLAQTAQGQPEQYRIWRWQRPALAIAFIDTGMLVTIVLLSIPLLWQQRYNPTVRFLVLSIICYATTMWIFFVYERYRMPLIIFYIPLASAAIACFIKAASVKKKFWLTIMFFLLYITTIKLNNINEAGAGWSPDPEIERSKLTKRLPHEQQVHQLMEDVILYPSAVRWAQLANIYAMRGFYSDAAEYASRAIALDAYEIRSYQSMFEIYIRQNDQAKLRKLLNDLSGLKDIPGNKQLAFSNLKKLITLKLND